MQTYKNYPLKKISTIGLGGTCREFCCPENTEELTNILHNNSVLSIGNGSNVCFVTDYYDGIILSLKKMSKYLSHDEEYISCSSNISCTKLARYLYNHQISGYEFLYGIPGTLGGAVFMNAGAFEKEILNNTHSIELLDKDGRLQTLFKKDIQYTYRNSGIDPKAVIISIKLHNPKIKFDSSMINNLDYKRKATQPVNQLSCGCIFKNPTHDFASELIESANLKGKRIGGIYISKKHSNYFINDGTGTHWDFLNLLDYVKHIVSLTHNVNLKEEVILIK